MIMNNLPIVLSIAGTDPSGGAGISADIKAISATGSYATAVITALVSQNTQGVQAIFNIPTDVIATQFDSIFDDLSVAAVKIGMLHQRNVIETVAKALRKFKPKNIVFDPVMVAKDGSVLLDLKAIRDLKQDIFPHVSLITPNLYEASVLLNQHISSLKEMQHAAFELGETHQTNVLIKGGHVNDDESRDVLYLYEESRLYEFTAIRTHTLNTHGTGCTLSAAIASYIAQDFSIIDAVGNAKKYITESIASGSRYRIGKGNGPVDHFYFLGNRS